MDAASQRGIDDIRDIRDRVVLQPVEGRSKIYILDEAHQLTDAAWNALLKLIEEPPPHLVFVFCTTELQKVAAHRSLALPDLRLPAAAARRHRPQAAPDRGRRGARRPRRGARPDRPRRARRLPRRRVDARPARRGNGRQDHRPGRPAAARRRRGGRAVPDVRPRGGRGHRRCTALRRGALGQGPGSRPARRRPARASPPPAARAAHDRSARFAARDRRDARAAPRAGEPAACAGRAPADRPAPRRGRRHAPGRRPAPAARARARQGDPSGGATSPASRCPSASSASKAGM